MSPRAEQSMIASATNCTGLTGYAFRVGHLLNRWRESTGCDGQCANWTDIDEYFPRTDSTGAQDFLTDALGSAVALTDSGGSVNTSYTYEPFGNVAVTGSNGNPFQFTGRENDGTGLYYYRARYYNPATDRFLEQYPLDFLGKDYNLYRYVSDNPTNLTDPNSPSRATRSAVQLCGTQIR